MAYSRRNPRRSIQAHNGKRRAHTRRGWSTVKDICRVQHHLPARMDLAPRCHLRAAALRQGASLPKHDCNRLRDNQVRSGTHHPRIDHGTSMHLGTAPRCCNQAQSTPTRRRMPNRGTPHDCRNRASSAWATSARERSSPRRRSLERIRRAHQRKGHGHGSRWRTRPRGRNPHRRIPMHRCKRSHRRCRALSSLRGSL